MAEVKSFSFAGSPFDFLSKLKEERGLSNEDIDRLGISVIPPVATKDELGWQEDTALTKLSYFDIDGHPLQDNRGHQFHRYRRHTPNAKGERYTQRKESGTRHYLPPTVGWYDIAKDPNIPIFYTEGEFKAITASKYLGPTVGNSGTRSWESSERDGLAAPLDQFVWGGRPVYICYDADAIASPSSPLKKTVRQDLSRLAFELNRVGAAVKVLYIARTPLFKVGEKLGLDDYFLKAVREGYDLERAKQDLLATAEDPELDPDFLKYMQTYAVYRGESPHVLDIFTMAKYSEKDMKFIEKAKIKDSKGKPIFKIVMFLENDNRPEFSRYVFDPSKPCGLLLDEGVFNHWSGFMAEPTKTENYAKHVEIYLKFQYGLWGAGVQEEGALDDVQYFNSWVAHMFQKPWEQTTISPVMQSHVKGIGKSLQGQIIRELVGRGAYVGDIDSLTGPWNDHLARTIFCQVDEASALHASKEAKLKGLYSDKVEIRERFCSNVLLDNYKRIYYTTNEDAPWRWDADERRWWAIRSPLRTEDGEGNSQWMKFLHGELIPLLKNKEFLNNIMSFYMGVDINKWNPTAKARATEAMEAIVEAGKTMKQTGADALYEQLPNVFVTNKTVRARDVKFWGIVDTMHHDLGGTKAEVIVREGEKLVAHVVWMKRGHALEVKPRPGKTPSLGGNQLSREQIIQMALNTGVLMDKLRSSLDETKF